MKYRNIISSLAFAMVLLLGNSVASAQQSGAMQDLIDGIIKDVIDRTVDTARQEVRRNTGNDPLKRGYDPSRRYKPTPAGASQETRRELRQLNEEHDRKIAKLEEELGRKLNKAENEFQREAAKEDKADKIEDKREKLQEKADEAYAKFEDKIGEENERFDEKRNDILSKPVSYPPQDAEY